jgi:hypothetical protein
VTLGEAATTPGGRLVGLTPSGVNWQAVREMVRKSTVTIQRIQLPHVPVVPWFPRVWLDSLDSTTGCSVTGYKRLALFTRSRVVAPCGGSNGYTAKNILVPSKKKSIVDISFFCSGTINYADVFF